MENVEKNSVANNAEQPKGEVKLHRIYVKSSLFETATLSLSLLKKPPQPVLDLQASVNIHQQEGGVHEAVLTLNLSAKYNGSLLWRAQLQQAGLYGLTGFTDDVQKRILNGFCMNQLYPYACAQVRNMVAQGGFLPAYLNPMNFEALYEEQLKREAKQPEPLVA